jgi:capsular exopolysaccharide synthesis family protein
MSRIQNILEKAERDGGLRRMRNLAESPATFVATQDPIEVSPALPLADLVEAPSAPEPVAKEGGIVTGARLNYRLVAALAPAAVVAEQYRALRTRILHANNGSAVNVVLVTSPGRAEGKTTTAANLALTMAQDFQRRTCIVDANLRHPQLHQLLGLTEGAGLADVLAGVVPLETALVNLEEYHLSVLPAGAPPARPAELLGSTAMRRVIETLRSRFDRVVIDAPAVVPLADIGIICPLVDTVVLVVRAGVTSKPSISDAVASIDEAKLLGIVLNEAAA